MDDISRCSFCGYESEDVECAGIYYCPNPICQGCGAAWFRQNMKSFTELPSGKHTIDVVELYDFGQWLINGDLPSDFKDAVAISLKSIEQHCAIEITEEVVNS